MNCKELRIGNLILFSEESTVFEITGVDKSGLYVRDNITKEETWIELDQFEGIKITEKILLNSDFERSQDLSGAPINDILEYYNLDGYKFMFDHNNKLMLCGYNWNTKHMKYVHELQNLFYDLSGIEIDIIIK